jgi:hypothetical protein
LDPSFSYLRGEKETKIDDLLEFCYIMDANENPVRYRLKYLNTIFEDYNERDPEISKIWDSINEKLGYLLRFIADICLKEGLFTQTQHERYFVSGKS